MSRCACSIWVTSIRASRRASVSRSRRETHAARTAFAIDRADTIRFNNQVMDLETLTTQLVQLKQTNPDIAIVIRPDRDLPVQKLIGVMDALQRAGITKVGIATRAEPN